MTDPQFYCWHLSHYSTLSHYSSPFVLLTHISANGPQFYVWFLFHHWSPFYYCSLMSLLVLRFPTGPHSTTDPYSTTGTHSTTIHHSTTGPHSTTGSIPLLIPFHYWFHSTTGPIPLLVLYNFTMKIQWHYQLIIEQFLYYSGSSHLSTNYWNYIYACRTYISEMCTFPTLVTSTCIWITNMWAIW